MYVYGATEHCQIEHLYTTAVAVVPTYIRIIVVAVLVGVV